MKKLLMFMTAAVIAASTLLVPVSADTPESLADHVATSIDYRTKDTNDITGNYFFVQPKPEKGPVTFVEHDGITCLDRTGPASQNEGYRYIYNPGHYQLLSEGFTMETYVYMTEALIGLPVQIFWGGDDSWSAFGWTGYEFGFGRPDSDLAINPDKSVKEDESREIEDGWYHLVVTADADTLKLYVNGELTGSGPFTNEIKAGIPGLMYFYLLKTEVEGYAMAYFTVYNVAATAEQVAEMAGKEIPSESPSASTEPTPSESASPSASTEPTPSESASPSASTEPTPSESASVAPSESTSPSSGSSATAVPTKAPDQSNAKTFDMGLVSFAAVALSSLVAVKKRK